MASFVPPVYAPYTWHDGSGGGTALNAADLMSAEDSMVAGFQAADEAVVTFVAANFTPATTTPFAPVNTALPVIS
jgi:hypothetical protein